MSPKRLCKSISSGHQFEFQNSPQGHAQLSQKLAKLPCPQVICEATGGYERPVVEALHQRQILVSALNPAHTLAASQAQGKRAKTDCGDAQALTDYGQRFQPAPTAPTSAEMRAITALAIWLKQWIENRAVAKTQAEHHAEEFVKQQRQELLAHYKHQIQCAEAELKKLVQAQAQFQRRVDCLQEIKGVAFRTALMTLVFMPRAGISQSGRGGGPGRPGPLDARERHDERQALHWRRTRPSASGSLHVGPQRHPLQSGPGPVLRGPGQKE